MNFNFFAQCSFLVLALLTGSRSLAKPVYVVLEDTVWGPHGTSNNDSDDVALSLSNDVALSLMMTLNSKCTRDYQGTPANSICITDQSLAEYLETIGKFSLRTIVAVTTGKMYCRTDESKLKFYHKLIGNLADGKNFTDCKSRLKNNHRS
jgi:hypothetical protein